MPYMPDHDLPDGHRSSNRDICLKSTYCQVTHGYLHSPGGILQDDVCNLLKGCISQAADTTLFPPKLLLLWLTPAFRDVYGSYENVLREIYVHLSDVKRDSVPLIGCSVAACIFDKDVHLEGALLTCFSSKYLEARVAAASGATTDSEAAADHVVTELFLNNRPYPNPRRDQFLFTFIPGIRIDDNATNLAPDFVRRLDKKTYGRFHFCGGVSSNGFTGGQGYQFCNDAVHADAPVVALLESKLIYGIGLCQGLQPTPMIFDVTEVLGDGRTIRTDPAATSISLMPKPWILKVDTVTGDRAVVVPTLDGDALKTTRPILEKSKAYLLRPDEPNMAKELHDVRQWLIDTYGTSPGRFAGLLGISCVSRYRERDAIQLHLPEALAALEKDFPQMTYSGCCLDGEIGINALGQSRIRNWSVSQFVLVDDIAPHAFHLLESELTRKYGDKLAKVESVRSAMTTVLACVAEAGCVGGMLSFVLKDSNLSWIVAQDAIGDNWRSIVMPRTRREFGGQDVLAIVASTGEPLYVRDATSDPVCDNDLAKEAGIYSFYAIPLRGKRNDTIAVLQVDLGDLRDKEDISPEQRHLLTAIGNMAAGTLRRAIQSEELEYSRKLDKYMQEAISSESEREAVEMFMEVAIDEVEADGFVRLLTTVNDRPVLEYVGGRGSFANWAATQHKTIPLTNTLCPAVLTQLKDRHILINDRLLATSSAVEGHIDDVPNDILAYGFFPIGHPEGGDPLGVVNIS